MIKEILGADPLDQLLQHRGSCRKYLKSYGSYLSKLLDSLDYETIEKIIYCLLKARERGSTIFFAGNGGSAATASHFSQDLGEVGRKVGARPFRTISLSDSTSFITALGNDYGYEKIFLGQMVNHFKKDDVLVVISASGNSRNIVNCVRWVREKGGVTIGFVGFDGGELLNLCDHLVHVKTKKGEYGPVEDIHLVLNHMITSLLIETASCFSKENRAK